MIGRRGFIAGLAASLFAAPAIVRASSLMPVRAIVLPTEFMDCDVILDGGFDLFVFENSRGEEVGRCFNGDFVQASRRYSDHAVSVKKLRSLVRPWAAPEYTADLRADIDAAFRVAA